MTYPDLDVIETPAWGGPSAARDRRLVVLLVLAGFALAAAVVSLHLTDRPVPAVRPPALPVSTPSAKAETAAALTAAAACTGRDLVGHVARHHMDRGYEFIVVAVTNKASRKCWVRGYPYFSVRSPRSSYIGVGVGFQGDNGVMGVIDPGDHVIWLRPDQIASFAIGARSGAPGAPRSATIQEFDFLPFAGSGPTMRIAQDGGLMTVSTEVFSDFRFGITAYARGII